MDDHLLSVLEDCQDLYQRRLKACSAIEQGFFLMACAQKQLGSNALRERNVREDIEPAVRVAMDDGSCELMINDTLQTNGAMLFSAMPPPALKQAVQQFPLESFGRQVSLIHQIQRRTQEMPARSQPAEAEAEAHATHDDMKADRGNSEETAGASASQPVA